MYNAAADAPSLRRIGRISLLALAAAVVLIVAPGWAGDRATTAVIDLSSVATAAVAVVMCHRAARGRHGAATGWHLLTAASALWALGEVLWTIPEVVLDREVSFPSIADVAYLGAVPFAVLGLLALARGASPGRRVRVVLDGCLMGGSLLFASWALVLGPIWRASDGASVSRIVEVAYPVTDLVMAMVALLVWRAAPAGERSALRWLSAGFLVMAVTDGAYTWMVNTDTFSSSSAISLGWPLGYAILALAATRATAAADTLDGERGQSLSGVLFPYVPLLFATSLAIERIVWDARPLGTFLTINAVGLLVVVSLRQALLALDLHRYVLVLNEREEELRHLALHDSLTGLANRANLARRFGARAVGGGPVALLYIDLDGFKQINDRFGHDTGDRFLVEVAGRLRACLDDGMFLARLGGDEFVIVVEHDREVAEELAARVIDAFGPDARIDGEALPLSASIGVASVGDGDTLDETIRRADAAMYVAKASGKGRAVRYPDHTVIAGQERPQLER